MTRNVRLAWLLVATILAGCTSSGTTSGTTSPFSPAPPSIASRATATPEPTTAPVATHPPVATPVPTRSAPVAAKPVTFEPREIAIVTATDGLRLRTKPGTGSDSERYAPLLPDGTDLYVQSGPVEASGYEWYEVSPISFHVTSLVESPNAHIGPDSSGWVAAAGRDGESWLGRGTASCPDTPGDVPTLARLTVGARLGCFGGVPLRVRARILPCDCSVEGPAEFRPSWLGASPQELLLAPPTGDGLAHRDWVWVRIDPAASVPDPLPTGDVVTVTGMFDHPAAARCEIRPADEKSFEPTEMCRSWFAVTAIE